MRHIRGVARAFALRIDPRSQRGLTVMESLVAVTLSSVVLGAATVMLGHVAHLGPKTERQLDAQDRARSAIDALAMELRNAIGPSGSTPLYSPGAGSSTPTTELVFYTPYASANTNNNTRGLRWVRYCLDYSDVSNATLWRQTANYDSTQPTPPSTATCPNAAWTTQGPVAMSLTNEQATGTACKDTATSLYHPFKPTPDAGGVIHDVRVCLLVKGEPTRPPTQITSSLDFRNAKSAPTAVVSCQGQNGHAVCDASASADPDGEALTYKWKYRCCNGTYTSGDTDWEAGQNSYLFDKGGLSPPSGRTFMVYAQVTDASGLATVGTTTVVVP